MIDEKADLWILMLFMGIQATKKDWCRWCFGCDLDKPAISKMAGYFKQGFVDDSMSCYRPFCEHIAVI
jgi:hypothetical protein